MSEIDKVTVHQTPEDRRMAEKYDKMSDEEIMALIRRRTAELGRLPVKTDFDGVFYLKARFGPWPRLLELAGVKPVPESRQRKIEARRRKQKKLRRRAAEKKSETQKGRCSG